MGDLKHSLKSHRRKIKCAGNIFVNKVDSLTEHADWEEIRKNIESKIFANKVDSLTERFNPWHGG